MKRRPPDTRDATQTALTLVFLAVYRPGERVIPAKRLAQSLGITEGAARYDIHAAARVAGVRLWHAREFGALVVERME